MCFSAQASFIASGGLAALGGATFAVAKKEDRLIATIPFIFGIQQFFEGIQWLYLNNGSVSYFAGYAFLFFALMFWPVYVPTFIYILDNKQKAFLKLFIIVGSAMSLYFLTVLLGQPLIIHKVNSCINYSFFSIKGPESLIYPLVVFVPLFISSHKIFRWFGLATAIFAIISWYYFTVNFISVWCFFSAVISVMLLVYVMFRRIK